MSTAAWLTMAFQPAKVPRNATQALADFDKAIALDPKHVNAYIYRGETQRSMGKYDKAFADFDTAIEIDPKVRRRIFFSSRHLLHNG